MTREQDAGLGAFSAIVLWGVIGMALLVLVTFLAGCTTLEVYVAAPRYLDVGDRYVQGDDSPCVVVVDGYAKCEVQP